MSQMKPHAALTTELYKLTTKNPAFTVNFKRAI